VQGSVADGSLSDTSEEPTAFFNGMNPERLVFACNATVARCPACPEVYADLGRGLPSAPGFF